MITKSASGTVFAGDSIHLYRVMVLRSALGLLAKGITPTHGLTSKKALAMAKLYTGQDYKPREHMRAMEDLKVWIETMKSAIPVEQNNG